tara:strand:+ start:769 stop:1989 length:1221 start_codon:yes stop_codon:yes gene_type:complete
MKDIKKYILYCCMALNILLVSQIAFAYTLLTSEQIIKKINGYDKKIQHLEENYNKNSKKLEEENLNIKSLNDKSLELEKEYQSILEQTKIIQSDIDKIKQQRDKELTTVSNKILNIDYDYKALLKKEKEISEQLTKDDNMRKAMAIRIETIDYVVSKGGTQRSDYNMNFSELIHYGMSKEYANIKVAYVSIDFIFEQFAPERWVWKGSTTRELLTGKRPERKIKRWLKECRKPLYKIIKQGTLGSLSGDDIQRFSRLCDPGQNVSNDIIVDFITEKKAYQKAMELIESNYPKTLKSLENQRKIIDAKKYAAKGLAKKTMDKNGNQYTNFVSRIQDLEKKLNDADSDNISSKRDKLNQDIRNKKRNISDLETKNLSIANKISKIKSKKREWEKNLESAIAHEKKSKD